MSGHEHVCNNEAAIERISVQLKDMKDDLDQTVVIQQRIAEELAENSRKTSEQIHALHLEIERQKLSVAVTTGDQRSAVEKFNSDRRQADTEMREKIRFYEEERARAIAQSDRINAELAKMNARFADGDKRIEKGEQAYAILKWVGVVVGGLLLTALVVRVFLKEMGAPPTRVGMKEPLASMIGTTSYLMAKIWAGAVALGGVVLMVVQGALSIKKLLWGG